MYLNDYQKYAKEFAIYPKDEAMIYTALGLCAEAGEVADKIKKAIRDGWHPSKLREEVAKELGDVMWYVAVLSDEFDLKLNDVAGGNLTKLQDRKMRSKLQGSGDNR